MVKSKQQLKQALKTRRAKNKDANAKLKQSKNWYPTSNVKGHFKRNSRKPRATKLRRDIKPGQVLVLLSGRFRGKRVVFLKQLTSGLLLVTGPYKLNGVPLKRVNQAYILATKTSVALPAMKHLDSVDDKFFTQKVNLEHDKKTNFFETPEAKKVRIIK
jgi:large subunit ribosomal protein L6e